ncbi:MAG: hypothetical protein Q4B77_04545 [Coriobacteriaceae bacterium]|nr:hypothetical protein [Coriobacteriaceae bacterium]
MDTPIVLSHKTAWLFHHAPLRHEVVREALNSSIDRYGLSEPHITAAQAAKRIVHFLSDCGVPVGMLEAGHARNGDCSEHAPIIELLVATSNDRTSSKLFKTYSLGRPFNSSHLMHAAPGLFVVNEALNFMQAPTWMNPLEVLEYGFELCGRYELQILSPRQAYVECEPRCSLETIRHTLDAIPGMRGAHRARRALARIREGSRSPMETALALSILLPQKDGGLGYRNISLNHQIKIPAVLKPQCASDYLEADVFAPKRRVDIEYDGGEHAELARRTHDSDRTATFGALGITQRTITAQHFAHQLEFHRSMNGIASLLRVDVPHSIEFQRKQNELRMFLIRNWNNNGNSNSGQHHGA